MAVTPRAAVTPESIVVKQCLVTLAMRNYLIVKQKTGFAAAFKVIESDRRIQGVLWRQNTGAAPLVGRGGKTYPIRFGVPGMSDIFGLHRTGRVMAIEVKRPGGKLSDKQRDFQAVVRLMGGFAVCVDSSAALAAALRELS